MRRGDPHRIYAAHRYGLFRRLVDAERIDALEAEHLIARWEREAEIIGTDRTDRHYWATAWDWITEQRKPREDPPSTDMDAEGDDGQVYGG
jgi:hypothetical protein